MLRGFSRIIGLSLLILAGSVGLWVYHGQFAAERKIEKLEEEKRVLQQVVTRLTSERRIAEVVVTDQQTIDDVTRTTLLFVEYARNGKPLPAKSFTIEGDTLHIDAQVIRFDAFTFALYHPEDHTLTLLSGYDSDIWVPSNTMSASGVPAERVIRERKSLMTLHSTDPAAAGSRTMGTGRRSESIIRSPMLGPDRVLGVMSVQSYTPEAYSEEDVTVLETIASLAATALENIRLAEENERLRAAAFAYFPGGIRESCNLVDPQAR